MFIHKFDTRNAGSIGDKAERMFVSLAGKRGYKVRHSTLNENKMSRIDFFLEKNNILKSFDVKARKKISYKDSSYNDNWTWVEFMTADGFPGWLYGEADYIAFEKKDSFLLVDRISLKNLSESLVDKKKEFAKLAWDAKYRIYQRRDNEEIALIKTDDIKRLNRISIWDKNNGF